MTETSTDSEQLPLAGLRVLDLCDGKGETCGRYLADLGADVVLVEPPGGVVTRTRQPVIADTSLYFATHNANKRSVELDLADADDRERFLELLAVADILIESGKPGAMDELELAPACLRDRFPHLVVLSFTEFGQTGPYRDYVATNSVHMAMSCMLARSGIKGREPLLPPGSTFVYESTAIQAAWVALLAYLRRRQTGIGDYLDFSVFEAATQILDPVLGVTGSAAGGRGAKQLVPRGRPPVGKGYPIFPCADGHVRICLLNPRQWNGMSEWLGDDHPFTDPSFAKMSVRYPRLREINAVIAGMFKDKKARDLVAEGQSRSVPIARVAEPGQVLEEEHFNVRGTFSELAVAPGVTGKVPTGYVEIDDDFCGMRTPAPAAGEHTEAVLANWTRSEEPSGPTATAETGRPLEGLRVLDLGVIVAGAELGRLFSDQGAEVIKIENHKYPDGLRQSMKNEAMTESVAQGCRGKKSFGLNLRSGKGKAIFKQLVAISDVVLSNFKPGTMESLGFDYETLRSVNPKIIVTDSSSFGSSGPLSRSMGYGPLCRASAGLTALWRYPDDTGSFSDTVTIVPDHFAARVSAVAILSLLIRRERTGEGGTVSLAQAECVLAAMADEYLRESLEPGSFVARGNSGEFDAPDGVFPCAGDDEWCVVAVRNDDDWQNLCRAIDRADLAEDQRYADASGRLANRKELDENLIAWTTRKSPVEVTQELQAVGIPAGFMQRLDEFDDNPHLQARNFFRTLDQPGLEYSLLTENAPAIADRLPVPDIRPAPYLAEHTVELGQQLLELSEEDIASLVEHGDLELMNQLV